jgi:1,4-dihydroxy-2-naphthoyl-CoA hydrolase
MPEFPDYDPSIADAAAGYRDETGIGAFVGITTDEVGPGTMRCSVVVRDDLLNPFGLMHGGVMSALCDHMLGAVCYPVIPRGTWPATQEFKVNLLAPVRDGEIRADARIMSISKRVVVVRIDVTNRGDDDSERLVALAQGTVSLQAPRA